MSFASLGPVKEKASVSSTVPPTSAIGSPKNKIEKNNPSRTEMTRHVVLITGALTGIGRATALAFAEEGARIVVSGRHDDEGQRLVGEIGKRGAEAEFVRISPTSLWPSSSCRP